MLKLSESSWGVEEPDAIIECLRSDRTTMGEKVQKFENDFSEWNGSKYALMVNSGSSANLLIASTLSFLNPPQKNRNTVIVPALSWSTTYFPWIQAGYKLKFVDINLDNFNIDINILKTKISSDVIGICVPHILGQDAGLSEIKKISEEYGIWFIEDTCESLGGVAQINGIDHKLGTLGLAGTFSFFRSHHISTMEGGMLITNNPDVYAVAKSIRAHGWSREVPQNKYLNNLNGMIYQIFSRVFLSYSPRYDPMCPGSHIKQDEPSDSNTFSNKLLFFITKLSCKNIKRSILVFSYTHLILPNSYPPVETRIYGTVNDLTMS